MKTPSQNTHSKKLAMKTLSQNTRSKKFADEEAILKHSQKNGDADALRKHSQKQIGDENALPKHWQ